MGDLICEKARVGDLPGPTERAEILMIHLALRGRDPGEFDLPALVRATDTFNGAELEEEVVSALYEAFAEKGSRAKKAPEANIQSFRFYLAQSQG